MEDKYYTPELQDFYVGFEYEFKIKIGDKEWHKIGYHPSDMAEAERFLNQLHTGLIRVKNLSKDQIEKEGWEYIGVMGCDHNEKSYYEFRFRKKIENGYIDLFYNQDSKLHVSSWDTANYTRTLYRGTCRCVNDFRKINKLLEL